MAGLVDLNIGEIATSVVDAGAGLLGKFIKDKDQAELLAHEIATMGAKQAHNQHMAHNKINEESAKHSSIFVAGARPAAIWVCLFALTNIIVTYPSVIFFAQFFDGENGQPIMLMLPPINEQIMWGVLSPLLGLGTMRTVEKLKGKARDNTRQASK